MFSISYGWVTKCKWALIVQRECCRLFCLFAAAKKKAVPCLTYSKEEEKGGGYAHCRNYEIASFRAEFHVLRVEV